MGSSNDAVPPQRKTRHFELVHMLPGEETGTLVLLGQCVHTGELIADYARIRKVVAVPVR